MRATTQHQPTQDSIADRSALTFKKHQVTFVKNGKRHTGRCFGVTPALQVWDPESNQVMLVAPGTAQIVDKEAK
jgi:hypothetical protein